MEATYLEQLTEKTSQLPLFVLMDINARVGDWLAGGGNENDEYIKQQLVYAKRVLKIHEGKSMNRIKEGC